MSLSQLARAPFETDQPPPYSPPDPAAAEWETSSIHSSAPSYVSAAPSYHSRCIHPTSATEDSHTTPRTTSGLLSSQHSAPGFRRLGPPRALNTLTDSHLRSLYNVAEWVPATGGLQARHYHNIATRRATESSMCMALARTVLPPPILEASTTAYNAAPSRDPSGHDVTECSGSDRLEESQTGLLIQGANGSNAGTPLDAVVDNNPEMAAGIPNVLDTSLDGSSDNPLLGNVPLSPHEDPHLVGEAAAARFRSQRLYISSQQQENQSAQLRRLSEITGQPRKSLSSSQASAPLAPSRERSHRQGESLDSQPGCISNGSTSAGPTGRLGRHRSTVQGTDEALKQEALTWDFMMAQMSDWQRREQSWKKFRDNVDGRLGAGILRGSCMQLGIKFDRSLNRVKSEKAGLGSNRKRFKKALSGLFTSDGTGFDASGYSV